MTLELRRLDPAFDDHYLAQSFRWLADSPTWRRHTEDVFGTLDYHGYMAAAFDRQRADIGIWWEGGLVAKVALHLTAKHTYEVSLEAARGTDPEVIVTAGLAIRDQLFGLYHAQLVYAWVPRWARGVKAILTSIGFSVDWVTMLKGTSRGRLIEWQRYSISASTDNDEQY